MDTTQLKRIADAMEEILTTGEGGPGTITGTKRKR